MSLYLSRLVIEPDSRLARRDLASPYEMHRTIMRAFPSADEGGPGRVLFRLENTMSDSEHMILVQSDKQPDWTALPVGYLADVRCKEFELSLPTGCRLRFRLRANPTVRRDGKRHGRFKEQEQREWLERKAAQGGFRVLNARIYGNQQVVSPALSHRRSPASHLAVIFEGLLQVTDPAQFAAAVASGIGPAKGFGFGLLSLARADNMVSA